MMSADSEETMKRFTKEAVIAVDEYLNQVNNALSETELSEEEIMASLDELRDHIITHCQLKSNDDEIITTDNVNAAVSKLGSPKTIAVTLQSELNFNYQVKQEELRSNADETTVDHITFSRYTIAIRAKHLAGLFILLSWLLTLCIMFVVFQLVEALLYYPWVYGFTMLTYALIRNSTVFKHNDYLHEQVHLNHHIMFTPLVYAVLAFMYRTSPSFASSTLSWLVPPVITLWLFISTTTGGRKYYQELVETLTP